MNEDLLLITAEMGLGHIRALVPFEKGMERTTNILGQTNHSSPKAKRFWKITLNAYEWLSRAKQWPLLGELLFALLNKLLYIEPLSHNVNFKKPTYQLKMLEKLIEKGICDEIFFLNEGKNLPILTSFYAPIIYLSALQPNTSVFCQICDADISRVWVPRDPERGKIHYLAPCREAVNRLLLYGVNKANIHLTGFPIPLELVGSKGQEIAINNYEKRLSYLKESRHLSRLSPLKIAYFIGGSGAMVDICIDAAQSLFGCINKGEVEFTIVPRPRKSTVKRMQKFKRRYFSSVDNLVVVGSVDRKEYFNKINKIFAETHILWTKPSELIFYSSLGIPIILTPPLGAQEEANRRWLLSNNIAVDQGKSEETLTWLKELLQEGHLWHMARNGWVNGIRTSVYRSEELIKKIS